MKSRTLSHHHRNTLFKQKTLEWRIWEIRSEKHPIKKQHQRVILFYDKFEAILCVFRAMSAASEFYETELRVFRVPGVFYSS